jgi:hypothetical protein
MTGSYITHDGDVPGACLTCAASLVFVFDPLDPKTMYTHATGLWRSTDGGERWELVYPNPSAVKGVKMNSDHADEQILADPDPLSEIAALAVDPSDSKILYAAAGTKESPALFISRDYGKGWQKQVSLPDVPRRLWVDPNSARDGRCFWQAHTRSRWSVTVECVPCRFPAMVTFRWVWFGPAIDDLCHFRARHLRFEGYRSELAQE